MDRYSGGKELFEAGKRAGQRGMWALVVPGAVVLGFYLALWFATLVENCP